MSIETGSSGQEFIKEKYPNLAGSKPVERAVIKARGQGEVVLDKKQDRINTYMDRLDRISQDDRGFEHLENKVINQYTLSLKNPETMVRLAEGLYESEKRVAIEQGRAGDIRQIESGHDMVELYKPLILEKAEIQKKTLASWLDYLRQNDAKQSNEFRYFVARSLEKMGSFSKETNLDTGEIEGIYSKRTETTLAPFPELNSEALGWVYKRVTQGIDPEDNLNPNKQQILEQLIAKKDFSKLYAFAQIETAGKLNKESLEGEWKKYDQGSDYQILENDLKSKGTGWCTAEGSAEGQLESGDFYVFFTKSPGGYTEPRVAIRMEKDQVAEVRGVNHRQELEPELINTAQEQYHHLPGGEKYDKKAQDMKKMTQLVVKQENKEPLTREDLVFLYEIDSKIEGFGYERDSRIEELRNQRDPSIDALIVFDCEPSQVAHTVDQINSTTKAYVGPLENGIFDQIQANDIEYIYTNFPEGKIQRSELQIGGQTKEQIEAGLEENKINIYSYAQDMLNSPDFYTLPQPEEIDLVRLQVSDLGFTDYPTIDEIYARAAELGLELCPPEVGPLQRLQDKDQAAGEWYNVVMKPIADRDGYPNVFSLDRRGDGFWLRSSRAMPADQWGVNDQFIFRLRKLSPEA